MARGIWISQGDKNYCSPPESDAR